MDKVDLIILIITTILLNSILLLIMLNIPVGDSIKEVPCYDRLSNEIKDLTCERKTDGFDSQIEKTLTIIAFLLIANLLNIWINSRK